MSGKLWIGVMEVGPIRTNCYILRNGADSKEAVLIDPGDQPEQILAELRREGTVPTAILLTHGHFDHILAVNRICQEMPDVKVYISEAEKTLVENPDLNGGRLHPGAVIHPDVFVKEGDLLELAGLRFKVLLTPGHTAGSCCYYMEEEESLFAGDTIFRESYGRTDLPTGSYAEIMKSLERLLTELPEDTAVFPGHGPGTTIGYEKRIEGF